MPCTDAMHTIILSVYNHTTHACAVTFAMSGRGGGGRGPYYKAKYGRGGRRVIVLVWTFMNMSWMSIIVRMHAFTAACPIHCRQ